MSELARKIEQPIETEEQRNRETGKHKNGETEEPRAETLKERERREYEEFWHNLAREHFNDYNENWTPERRKSFIEDGAEFLVDVAGGGRRYCCLHG